MSDYPAEITDLRTLDNRNGVVYDADKKSVLFAEDINKIIAEVEAIENELGIEVKGDEDDLKARIEKIMYQ